MGEAPRSSVTTLQDRFGAVYYFGISQLKSGKFDSGKKVSVFVEPGKTANPMLIS